MATFYLHIGMHKTASSACQLVFEENRELLARQGLRYFRSFDPNHSYFLIRFFEVDRRDFAKLINSRHVDPRYATESDALWRSWADFLEETARAGDDALVSAEVGGFLAEESVIRLRDQVLAHFDRMIVLMLVRPPLSFARSAAQQRLKGQHSLEGLRFLPDPQYRRRLGAYEQALGARCIRLELFCAERMVDGDPARTLLAMTGREGSAVAGIAAPLVNEALSVRGAKLLSALQTIRRDPAAEERFPAVMREALQAMRTRFDYAGLLAGDYAGRMLPPFWQSVARGIAGERFGLPHEVQRAMSAKIRKDARWISALLGEDIEAWDDPIDPDAPTLARMTHIDDEDAAAIADHLRGYARKARGRATARRRDREARASPPSDSAPS